MTPKEAFKEYKKLAKEFKDGEWEYHSAYIELGKELLEIAPIIEQALTELEALKRYPTSEEVCEALNTDVSLYPKIFYYDEISKTFKEIHISRNEEIVSYYKNGTITINPNYGISPHLITLIGRFYEGLK